MNKILFQQLETLKSESPVQNAVIDETIKMIKQLKAELDELKKQPEPTEFTKRIRWLIKDIDLGYQPRGMVEITKEDILEACDIIDNLTAWKGVYQSKIKEVKHSFEEMKELYEKIV